jgi:hypothetical protein
MTILLNVPVTTAVSALVTAPEQFRDGNPESAIIQGTFTYGSGGTTANAWVQTSVDEGATWTDVANFSFTTASVRALFNLSALTVKTTQLTAVTDGSLAANTALDGFLGPLWRVKYTTTGTYAGGTVLRVDMAPRGHLTT